MARREDDDRVQDAAPPACNLHSEITRVLGGKAASLSRQLSGARIAFGVPAVSCGGKGLQVEALRLPCMTLQIRRTAAVPLQPVCEAS